MATPSPPATESPEATTQQDLMDTVNRIRSKSARGESLRIVLCDPIGSKVVRIDWPAISEALASVETPSAVQAVTLDLAEASTEVVRKWHLSLLPALGSSPLRASVEHVTFRHCNVTPTLCSSVLEALNATRLRTLDLSFNPLGPRGAKLLATFLKATERLSGLNVRHASLGHFGAQALGGGLPPTLTVLNVSHNSMGHDGIWKFADTGLTQRLSDLSELDISSNQIGDDGCLVIANRLSFIDKLVSLDLSHSDIGRVGIEGLANCLMCLDSNRSFSSSLWSGLASSYDSFDNGDSSSTSVGLCRLSLSHNRLDNVSAQHLGMALTKLVGLKHLNLSYNSIGDEGAEALVDGLLAQPDRQLQVLDLSHNLIGDLGAGSFVEHLESLTSLQTLLLSDNKISHARSRILSLLMKHRQPARPTTLRDKIPATSDAGGSRKMDSAPEAMVDETEGSGEYNSGEDDHDGTGADLDEEQLERGRENLADLLRELDDEESSDGAPSFDRTDRLLRHQRNQLPMAYLRHMTHDFSKSCVQNTGVFGTLYLARDAEQDDEEHEPTFVLRKLDLGPAGPLKAVRDSVLDELVGECRQLRLSGFIPALAVTVAPTSVYLLYNVTDMLALRQLLSEPSHRRDLTLRMRVEILHKVALALHCLHTGGGNVGSFPGKRVSKPSFHGDVQPSNIYISVAHDGSGLRCDRVRMTDALVSRVVATDRRRFRHGDAVFGSRSYRCPRYERGSSSYDASSDMFSFGVVMAETLSGQLQRSPVKPSNDWQGGSTLFYDVYYDVVLAKEPFAFDPMRQEAKTALGESAVPAPPPTSPRAMQMLVQVMVSCLGPSPTKRPTAATVTRILEHEYLVAYRK